jgi:hypothetical protein
MTENQATDQSKRVYRVDKFIVPPSGTRRVS